MRKIRAATFVSLDGVMQGPGAPEEDPSGGFNLGGWTATYWDEGMGKAMSEAFSKPFDLLLGRKTYEIFAAHWPHLKGDPVADVFNACAKYVATRSNKPLTWQNSVALHDPVSDLARLKAGEGPDLLIQGSSNLIQTLLAHGLIDEFSLMVFPVVLGKGKRLFGDGAVPGALTLMDTAISTTGVVTSTYVPAGEVATGSFALEEPSPDEVARRNALAQEDA